MRLAHVHAGPNVLARASIIQVHADVYNAYFFLHPSLEFEPFSS